VPFSSVRVRCEGHTLEITLVDVAPVHRLALALDEASGGSTPIALRPVGRDLIGELDLRSLPLVKGWRGDFVLADGPVKVAWEHVPWEVDDLASRSVHGVEVLVTCSRRAPLCVIVQPDALETPAISTRRLSSSGRSLTLQAELSLAPHRIQTIVVRTVERATGREQLYPANPTRLSHQVGPWRRYRVEARVSWEDIDSEAREEFQDVSLLVTSQAGTAAVRVPASVSFAGQLGRLRSGLVERGETATFYDPRLTFKARLLTIYTSTLPAESVRTFHRLAKGLGLRRWLYRRRNRPLWLIGELPYKAQDTGAAFFAYVCAEHPEIDARYVVAHDSPDLAAIQAVGPTLIHGSPEHVAAALLADRVVGSHHADYLFPARVPAVRKKVRGIRVFLQHGVMGTKWMANLYGRGLGGFVTDLFIVSSPRERDLIRRDFHYRPEQIAVTGLSRFDTLLTPSEPRQQIAVIPTWRDWVLTPEDFRESEFLERWRSLLTHPRFAQLARGCDVVVMLHPNFRHFVEDLDVPGVQIRHQGDIPVQELLRTSRLLVTDYSSVGFDFALLHRPVVYYQFDRDRFLGARGSHLDLDSDLPGDVCVSEDGVLGALERRAGDGFAQEPAHGALANSYFPMQDTRSRQRIFEAVLTARRTRPGTLRRRAAKALRIVATQLRRRRLHLPALRAIYRLSRLLPLRSDTVVFECDLGRGYGDSPKALYRELVRTRPDLRVVWAANIPIPDASERTSVVPRLSVAYFRALARAKYLITNQSFPSYVRRRRRQVLVQTWHGTPLKRMLHDLDHITGRDAGYVDRATTAAAQWSVLISPNAHTTAAMASAFQHHARVLEVGYPRNDIFFGSQASEAANKVRARLGIGRDRKLVLFAPTFRDAGLDRELVAGPSEAIDLRRFGRELGDRATLVIRRHILDTHAAAIPDEVAHCIIDATSYPDVQELLVAADVLVTDYSSVFFDYLNTRRPCVFFAPDLEEYRDHVRGFYLDYEKDLPGPIVKGMDELLDCLATAVDHGSFPGYNLDAFAGRYCPHDDGGAAARVIAELFGTGVR